MWQSILDFIEEIESKEAELEQILQRQQGDRSMADETVNVQFDEEEADVLNGTFVKVPIEMDVTYENSILFNNTGGQIEPAANNHTPIPKKLQINKKKCERRKTRNLFNNPAQTLPTVFELE